MGIIFTTHMGFLFTITQGILFTIVLGIQFTISIISEILSSKAISLSTTTVAPFLLGLSSLGIQRLWLFLGSPSTSGSSFSKVS